MTVTVFGATDPPEAIDDPNEETTEDSAVTIAVLANDINHSANPLSVVELAGGPATPTDATPPTGRVTTEPAAGSPNNTVVYNPDGRFDDLKQGETRIDTFTYRVSDGSQSDWAPVTAPSTGGNDSPGPIFDPTAYTWPQGAPPVPAAARQRTPRPHPGASACR